MSDGLLIAVVLLVLVNVVLTALLLKKKPQNTGEFEQALERLEKRNSSEASQTRAEITNQFQAMGQMSVTAISQVAQNTQRELENMRATMDRRLLEMRMENEKSLAGMRDTVDKKLQETVSSGIDASFKAVSSQLQRVYTSVGEMRTLTHDIVDLKHILSNVKNRGTWGEVQLGALIEDMLAPGQFEREFSLKQGREKVDYAVRLPGRGEGEVYLPIDSKFPMDRYQAVLLAENAEDQAAVALTRDALKRAITEEAKKIRTKYVIPPVTTDFAVLFVPSEGLYAYLCSTELPFTLQQEQRVLLAGPSTLAALLNSLQLGFRTLAIEKQSGEIYKLLGAVKTAFSSFTKNLEGVQSNLNAAANKLEKASSNSRNIQRRLKNLEEVDEGQAQALLGEEFFEQED